MKKSLSLAVVIFILISCTVQKKQLYVFSYYGYITKADGTLKMPGETIPTNITASNFSDTTRCEKELVNTVDPPVKREVRLLKQPKLHPRRINKVINEQRIASEKREFKVDTVQPVEKKKRKNGDRLLYLVASLMGIAIIGLTRLFRPMTTRITRWAKANPKTTQGVIAGIHVPLLALGVMNGHNLYEMGYDTSNTMMYTFGATTALGLLLSPLKRNREPISLPRKVNMQRLAFASLTISSLMMMVGLGSRIHQNYPDSTFTKVVHSIDQSTFSYSSDPSTNSDKILQDRKGAGRMSAGAAAVAIFFLVLLACAGICLIIGAFAGAFASLGAAIGVGLLGAAILIMSVMGMNKVSKMRKETRELEEKQKKEKGL